MKEKYNEVKPTVKVDEVQEVQEVTEKKTLERVVTVEPKKIKRGLINRLVSGVVGPEGVSGIGEYVNDEIVKPAIKNIIVDAVTSGINMIMYGERGGRGGGYRGTERNYSRQYQQSVSQKTQYVSRYTQHQQEPAQLPAPTVRRGYGIEEYSLASRDDAMHVMVTLTENADVYGSVSVADYYDLIGIPSVYTDNDYGWSRESIHRAVIVPVRGGFVIKFPQVEVI